MQVGLTVLLFGTFFVLKVTGVIDWSWVAVFSPLLISAAIAALIFLGALMGLIIITKRKRE